MTATNGRTPLSDRLTSSRVIAVLRAGHASALAPVCDVLVEEGMLSLELTLTTPELFDSLSGLVDRYADTADIGVGTVLNTADASRAIDCGAQYLVTPTMNLDVIELALQQQVAIFPGGFSPTELATGWAAGATAVKIFPAQTVGAGYLAHLRGPFPDLQAVPSGGVDLDATQQWLAAGAAAVSIGGPLLGDALVGGDPSELRERCRAVTVAVAEATAQ
jgi:2-dehydro-3-deoxyphosphogluconate aldolase / (4S)-4-hydroxy-2-oxoglutarate aldolase